jgi:hypothetical protein
MRIRLHKAQADRVTCLRADGTLTEADLSPGSAYHDLAHYVVERAMCYQEGFWGMIAQGHPFSEYDKPNETRAFQISTEGYHAEFLATLVQSAVYSGAISADYYALLRDASTAAGLPFPALPPADVCAALITETQALTQAWAKLPLGETLELEF